LDFVPDDTYLRKLLGDCQRTGITLSYCGICRVNSAKRLFTTFKTTGEGIVPADASFTA
jgi:hypothetical protein